jgi:hypothetical protein
VIIFSGFVIWRTPAETDLETRKLRIADAVLIGLLALFIFTAILYFVDAEGAGAEISTKLLQSFLLWWARSLATFLVPEQNSEPRRWGERPLDLGGLMASPAVVPRTSAINVLQWLTSLNCTH